MSKRVAWGVLGGLAGASAVGTAALAGATTWTLNGPWRPWPDYAFTPFEVGLEAADVQLDADGVGLAGWYFDDPDADVAVICCHGHRGTKSDMLGIGPGLHRAGFSVLLFDFRGSGDSSDGPRSMAHHEQRDLRAAVDWVSRRRPDVRIAVVAFSMGAATAILAAASDERIDALVLDSPFATLKGVVAANYRRYHLPFTGLLPAVDLVNRAAYGYGFKAVRPIDAMGALAPRPVLLLHGTRDRVIPHADALALVDAAAPGTVEFVEFEGADHCGGYFLDRPGYIARVADFLRRQVGAQATSSTSLPSGSSTTAS